MTTFVSTLLLLALVPADAAVNETVSMSQQQQQARDSVRKGQFVPLEQVLEDALRRYPGKLVEVELEDDDEYEVEILGADGVVMELEYDAVSGKLLNIEVED